MATTIPDLKWSAYQGAQKGTLVAVINLDSATDTDWVIPITGQYNNDIIAASEVVVFNDTNNGPVVLSAGPITFPVNPFSRDSLALSGSTGQNIGVHFTVGTIQLQIYAGKPPYNPSLINQAGANSVNNNTLQISTVAITSNGIFAGVYPTGTNALPTPAGGTSLFNTTFTPKNAASVIEISIQIKGYSFGTDAYTLALFVDGNYVDHVTGAILSSPGNNNYITLLTWINPSGTTVLETFELRIGSNTGAAFALNETNGGGPVPGWKSWIVFKEFLPQ